MQDTFLKKSDFEITDLEIMKKFYYGSEELCHSLVEENANAHDISISHNANAAKSAKTAPTDNMLPKELDHL